MLAAALKVLASRLPAHGDAPQPQPQPGVGSPLRAAAAQPSAADVALLAALSEPLRTAHLAVQVPAQISARLEWTQRALLATHAPIAPAADRAGAAPRVRAALDSVAESWRAHMEAAPHTAGSASAAAAHEARTAAREVERAAAAREDAAAAASAALRASELVVSLTVVALEASTELLATAADGRAVLRASLWGATGGAQATGALALGRSGATSPRALAVPLRSAHEHAVGEAGAGSGGGATLAFRVDVRALLGAAGAESAEVRAARVACRDGHASSLRTARPFVRSANARRARACLSPLCAHSSRCSCRRHRRLRSWRWAALCHKAPSSPPPRSRCSPSRSRPPACTARPCAVRRRAARALRLRTRPRSRGRPAQIRRSPPSACVYACPCSIRTRPSALASLSSPPLG